MKRLRVGAVSYLNTKPLVYGLCDYPQIDLTFDLPSRLADRLARGDLDVALIPSIESFADPSYRIVSDACISARGPVWSVKLLSKVPFEQIRTCSFDEGSRTSVALVRILLKRRFQIEPDGVLLPIHCNPFTVSTDAVLVIGDRAIRAEKSTMLFQWDLADEWVKETGLPFVFATWIARENLELNGASSILKRARDEGVERFEEIAQREAALYGVSVEQCCKYFREHLHFRLGSNELQGMERFRVEAFELGLISNSSPLDFHDQNHFAKSH